MSQLSKCKWKASKHNGQPCPYHTALSRMVQAAKNFDYAAYETAKQDADKYKNIDESQRKSFFRKEAPSEPKQDIAIIDATAENAFDYDDSKRPGITGNTNPIELGDGTVIFEGAYTLRRKGVHYHTGESESSREEMLQKIDELFVEGKTAAATGLLADLKATDTIRKEKSLSDVVNKPNVANLLNAARERAAEEIVKPSTTPPAFSIEGIDFDAEVLTYKEGLVATFSTSGGENYSKHKIPISIQEVQRVDSDMVKRLSSRNDEYKNDAIEAMKATSDQETREGIAMHFIHATEFDKATDSYPEGPAKNIMKAEVAGMFQYASRFEKYQKGKTYSDDADYFASTRLGDINRYDSNNEDRAGMFTLEEKMIANGVTRQLEVAIEAYDDEKWGKYFTESRKYFLKK